MKIEFAIRARQRLVSRATNGQGQDGIKRLCFSFLELRDAINGSSAQ